MTGLPREVFGRNGADAPAPQQTSTLSTPEPWFVRWATGNHAGEPGPVVNEHTALNYLAVYSCVSLIAGTVASLPLITYKRDGRARQRAADLPVYHVLHTSFNPRMTSAVARETSVAHLLTWGNSYAQVVWNKSGSTVLQLNPLGPDCVTVTEVGDGTGLQLAYEVRQRGTGESLGTLEAKEVVHVPGLGFDGLVGYSPVRVARTSIRAGMSQDREAERFITRGIRPPGAIKFDKGKKFKDEQEAMEYRRRFRAIHSGEDSSLNVMVLEDGAGWQQLGLDPESSQLLESRQFSRGEIAGLYRVPPHMVGDSEKSTSWGTGIGEQVDGFIKFTLLPWLTKIEQEYNRKLFGGGQELYAEHLLEGLERADLVKRTQAFKEQLLLGVRSPNEVREVENLNPHPGGDCYFFPLNMGRMDADGNDIPPPAAAAPPTPPAPTPVPPPAEAKSPAALADPLRRVFVSAVGRALRREAEQAKRAAGRPNGFVAWVDEFCAAHLEFLREAVGPAVEAWDTAFPGAAVGDYPARHVERSRADLLAVCECKAEELPARVGRLTERWLSERLAHAAAELRA